jgi:peptide/nickel transport system permease protein
MVQADVATSGTLEAQVESTTSVDLATRLHLRMWLWLLMLSPVILLLFCAVVPDLFQLHDPQHQNLRARLLPPWSTSSDGFHPFGTDSLGRDLYSQMVEGTRLTLTIAVVATAIGCAFGVLVGLVSGYFGGWLDRFLSRLSEAQTAMPMFLVAILLLSLLGPSVTILLIVLPTLLWPIFARVVRAESMRLKESLFIEAAIAVGCSPMTLLRSHMLPNIAPRILVLAVIEVGHVMLAEAGLSFLGVGVQPPDVTWGLLIAGGRPLLAVAWWLTILPGVLLAMTVLILNLFGRQFERFSGAAA